MTTTRSLLPEAVTAGWIWRYLHRFASLRLIAISPRARFALRLRRSVGRIAKPLRRARRIERARRCSEFFLQTTRVSPRSLLSSAEASDLTLGTLPPAAGVTLRSGAGLGQ